MQSARCWLTDMTPKTVRSQEAAVSPPCLSVPSRERTRQPVWTLRDRWPFLSRGWALGCMLAIAAVGEWHRPPVALAQQLPPEIQAIADTASTIAGGFSGVNTAVSAITAVLQFLGVLPSESATIQAQLAALQRQLDNAVGAICWEISSEFRGQRLAQGIAAVLAAGESLQRQQPVDPAIDLQALTAVIEAEQEQAFQRCFVSSIDPSPIPPNGQVYDWRQGIPTLLQLIALRLHVIAAVDPNFRVDHAFDHELLVHVAALDTHYRKMQDGIRCVSWATGGWGNGPLLDTISCKDLATGHGYAQSIPGRLAPDACILGVNPDGTTRWSNSPSCQTAVQNWLVWKQANITPVEDALRAQIMDDMPLAAMAQLMELLKQLASPADCHAQVIRLRGVQPFPCAVDLTCNDTTPAFFKKQQGAQWGTLSNTLDPQSVPVGTAVMYQACDLQAGYEECSPPFAVAYPPLCRRAGVAEVLLGFSLR